MANWLLRLLYRTPNLHTPLGRWRIAVANALGPWETSLPMPWPGDICTGPLIDGAVRDILPAGSLRPDSVIWYSGPAKTLELLRVTYTRNEQGLVTGIEWRVRDTAGSLVMTITDAVTYLGLVETTRTRTVVI